MARTGRRTPPAGQVRRAAEALEEAESAYHRAVEDWRHATPGAFVEAWCRMVKARLRVDAAGGDGGTNEADAHAM